MLPEIYLPEIKTIEKKNNTGAFSIEPLYPGYGMTLGNALRRVILSSLGGAAVTAVAIEGASHEFSTIPQVKEDLIEIIMNLKNLRVKILSESTKELLHLKVSKKGAVKAKDIGKNPNVEIVNPDLVIANLDSDKAKLEMTIIIERGRGYVPIEKREKEKLEQGMIAMDALFSPVKSVSYSVENTRVGQMTDLDRLIIKIETDGILEPQEAVAQASEILVDHFLVISGKKIVSRETSKEKGGDDSPEKILIEEVNFSARTANTLINNEIKTIGDILKLSDDELRNLKGFGDKAYTEVKDKIKELGFKFEK